MGKKVNIETEEAKPKLAKSLKDSVRSSCIKKKKMKVLPLNPMNFHPRFTHITEKFFKLLENLSRR